MPAQLWVGIDPDGRELERVTRGLLEGDPAASDRPKLWKELNAVVGRVVSALKPVERFPWPAM